MYYEEPTETVALRVEVLVSLLGRHDVGALYAKVERTKGYDGLAVVVDVCLRYYTRLIVYKLENRSVGVDGLLARVLEHLSHVLYSQRLVAPHWSPELTYHTRIQYAPSGYWALCCLSHS